MNRSIKIAIGVLIGIGVLAAGLLLANNYLEKKIKTSLEENLKKANTSFDKVDVKLLDRTAEVINPFIEIKGKTLKVDTILINDIHLWDYLTDKDIIIGELLIANPKAELYKLKNKPKDTTSKKKKSEFKNKLLIKNVKVTKGHFRMFEEDSSEHSLYASIKSLKLENVRINSTTLKETIPFNYELILLNADSLFYDLDKQHELSIGNLLMDNNMLDIVDFRVIPKYSKNAHQKTIRTEKDRYDLSVDSISLDNFNWTVVNDSLKFQNSFAAISGVQFEIYRDKLQPDDTRRKPLYSEMIREMPVLLNLDSIKLKNIYIKYEENIREEREAGVVEFSNLNGTIKNITNIDLNREDFPETRITANADFMGSAPLSIDWSFKINDREDRFRLSGSMGSLAAEQMNNFLKPAMNIEAKGEILDMYFNFSGNDNSANGDMRLEYKDFKIEVLRKDGKKRNKIISAIANVFVKNKALNEKADQKDINYSRDKTKSFWNYFWNLIKNGALKAFL